MLIARRSWQLVLCKKARRSGFSLRWRDTVKRGTAKSISETLENNGWQIGGKTGSGTALMPRARKLTVGSLDSFSIRKGRLDSQLPHLSGAEDTEEKTRRRFQRS
jgi:hypothetical protein